MLKIQLSSGENLREALAELLPEIGAELACCEADLCVEVKESEEDILQVSLNGKNAVLTYGGGKARAFRGFAKLVSAVKAGETSLLCEEHPSFKKNGAMVDVSRANVLNLDSVKFMFRKMALMGQNQFMLYTEDIFEVEKRPYFGYMRGRYSKKELKELDAYAMMLGIELIPCLELLSHMSAVLQWPATGAYKDTSWTLFVDRDQTYDFIGDLLDAISECFTTKKIHIGLDETWDLGTGSYLSSRGYAPIEELFYKHLNRLGAMLKERGFEPMMWSDMPFHFYGKGMPVYDARITLPDDIGEKLAGVRPVFWAYSDLGPERFDKVMREHKKIPGETMFAGGIWIWSGFAPIYEHSKKGTIGGLEACIRNDVRDVLATIWTNGSEGSAILTLAGLAWYADIDYIGKFDEDSVRKCFADATGGLSYDDFMVLEALEHPTEADFCATRALCYNDPMLPLADAHLPEGGVGEYYRKTTEAIRAASENKAEFAPAFRQLLCLSELLELKADFGIRLKKAYDTNDRAAMEALLADCDVITERIRALAAAHKEAFFRYNKPFGYELHDIRYGGMLLRFETTKERISAYLAGEISALEELEEERLPYKPNTEGSLGNTFMWIRHRQIASPSLSIPI